MSHRHRIIAIVLAMLMSLSLVSCGNDEVQDPLMEESKETLVDMVNTLNTENGNYLNRISELETMLRGVQGEEVETSGITEMGDGTGRLTFNSVDDVITLPVEFNYPGATQADNTSSVEINEAFSFRPTSNWTVQMSGTSIGLYHTSGISGTIKVGMRDRTAQRTTVAEVETYMKEQFFSQLPPETVKYSTLFVNGTSYGVDAESHTFIDEADARLRCGLLGYSDYSLQYFFVYTGEQDSAKDEVILSLLQTIRIYNYNLSIQ